MAHVTYLRSFVLLMLGALIAEGANVFTAQPGNQTMSDSKVKATGESVQKQSRVAGRQSQVSDNNIWNGVKEPSEIFDEVSKFGPHRKMELQEKESADSDPSYTSTVRESNIGDKEESILSSHRDPSVGNNQQVRYEDICRLKSHGPKQFIYKDKFLCKPCKCYYKCDNSISATCDDFSTMDKIKKGLKNETRYLTISLSKMSSFSASDFLRYQNLTSLTISKNFKLCRIVNSTVNDQLKMLTALNMSTNRINSIDENSFRIMPNLLNLTLCHNNILHITNSTFKGLDNLQILNLSVNNIRLIESDSFRNCPHLKILDLSRNEGLGYNHTFPSEFFRNIKNLNEFYIYGNYKTKQNYSNIDFGQLTNLKLLATDGTDLSPPFGPDIKMLKNLTTLQLGLLIKDKCSLHKLTRSFFENLPFLKTVTIAKCPLTKVDFDAFASLVFLRKLELINIKTYNFSAAFNELQKLQNSSLKSLSFVDMVARNNSGIVLFEEQSTFLKNIDLEELDLSENAITAIEHQFIRNLPKTLKKLILRQNRLVEFSLYLYKLSYLKKLVLLDFSMEAKVVSSRITNCSSHVGEIVNDHGYLDTEESQEYLYMDENDDNFLTSQTEDKYSINNYKETDISIDSYLSKREITAKVSGLNTSGKMEPEIIMAISPNLQYLLAPRYLNMDIGLVLAIIRRPLRNNLTNIDFSDCFIQQLGRHTTIPPNIQILNLDGNFFRQLPCQIFMYNNSLKYLSLKNNLLGQYFLINNGTVFRKLQNLTYLDISMNMIFELRRNFFQGLENIQILNMMKNKLQVLDIDFSLMRSLKYIDLNMNSISWITRRTRDELDVIGSSHDLYIDLSLNPLRCTCEGLEVLHWIWGSNIYFVSKDFLRCLRDDGSADDVGKIDDRVRTLQRYCTGKAVIIVLCVACLVITFILVGFGLMYRFRWQLRYIRSIALSRFMGYKPRNALDSSYKYDAYILYSESSRKFVISKCMQELEVKRGHKLCFDDRDFMPGTLAVSAVVGAVQNSRRTLLILTPDFYDEEYSEYAVKMAIMEEIYSKRTVLHLCIYQSMPDDEISGCQDLLMILKRNSYTECPPEENASKEMFESFWDQISQIIGQTAKQGEGITTGELTGNDHVSSTMDTTGQETPRRSVVHTDEHDSGGDKDGRRSLL